MESEKVKEIKKALEYCSNGCDCDCPFYSNGSAYEKCRNFLFETLTLINELEGENERLTKQCTDWQDLYRENTKRHSKLKDRIGELENENGELNEKLIVFDPISAFADNYAKGVKEAEKVVAEALKQFAERLKEKLYNHRI